MEWVIKLILRELTIKEPQGSFFVARKNKTYLIVLDFSTSFNYNFPVTDMVHISLRDMRMEGESNATW